MKKNVATVFMAGLMILNSMPVHAGDLAKVGQWLKEKDVDPDTLGMAAGIIHGGALGAVSVVKKRRAAATPIPRLSNENEADVIARASAGYVAQRDQIYRDITRLNDEIDKEKASPHYRDALTQEKIKRLEKELSVELDKAKVTRMKIAQIPNFFAKKGEIALLNEADRNHLSIYVPEYDSVLAKKASIRASSAAVGERNAREEAVARGTKKVILASFAVTAVTLVAGQEAIDAADEEAREAENAKADAAKAGTAEVGTAK